MRSFIVITATVVLGTNLQAHDPKSYASKEGKFKVIFPGEPEVTTKKSDDNEKLYMASYTPQGGGGFFVIYSDLQGDKLKDSTPKEILESGKEGLVRTVMAKNLKSKEIEFGKGDEKYPALRIEGDATIPNENDKIHLNMIIILAPNNRLYQVFVIGPKDLASSKDATKFFDSFEITK